MRFDRGRGRALGIAMAGVGAGAALVPQFTQQMIGITGWRGAYVSLGVLTLLLAFPAVAVFVGRPLSERQVVAQRISVGLTGMEALRTARFWSLAFSFFVVAGTTGGVIAHLVR